MLVRVLDSLTIILKLRHVGKGSEEYIIGFK